MSSSPASEAIRRKTAMSEYLSELATLTGRIVSAGELGSSEEAAILRVKAQETLTRRGVCWHMPFSERATDRFRKYVLSLDASRRCAVYVWTPRTIECGTFLTQSLASLKFDFPFEINPEGILSITTFDLSDRILLDFGRSSDGEERLSVEVQGVSWENVTYQGPTLAA